jgi:hypothetical protein
LVDPRAPPDFLVVVDRYLASVAANCIAQCEMSLMRAAHEDVHLLAFVQAAAQWRGVLPKRRAAIG